jgi:hypothetical protein
MSRLLRFWVSLLPAVILTPACHTFARTETENVVRFKLENYGWQRLPERQPSEWAGTRSRLVSIDHKGRVLVGFTTRENQSLASREHPGLSFHILRLTPEGKVDLSLVLPTNNWFNNGFYLGSDDHVYARVNDALQFLSEEPDARNAGGVWKTLASCSMNCEISQSSSRRTLIIRELLGPDHYTYTVLDVSSSLPRVVQSCPSFAFYAEIITDQFAYQSSDNISTDVRRWPFCDQEHGVELPLDMRGGFLRALNDEALLLLGTGKDSRGVELVAPDGQVKFRKEMAKHELVPGYWTRSDERGDRFAFTVETWQGGSRALDISGKRVASRVVVYTQTGQQLTAVSLNPVYHRSDFDLALSPDGQRLAILDEGVVTVTNIE